MQLSAYMLQPQNSKRGRQATSIWVGHKHILLGCASIWTPSGSVMRAADIQPLSWIEQRHGNFQMACPPSCPTADTWGKSNAYLSRYSNIRWNTIMEEWKLCPMLFNAMIMILVSFICTLVVESMEIRRECENWQVLSWMNFCQIASMYAYHFRPFEKGYNSPLNRNVSENCTKTKMPSGDDTVTINWVQINLFL